MNREWWMTATPEQQIGAILCLAGILFCAGMIFLLAWKWHR